MMRKIVTAKSPSLREKSKEVKKIDKKIKSLVSDMRETLASQKDPEGVGLAAPQVGKNLRLFILNFDSTERVIINPKIVKISKTLIKKQKKGKINKVSSDDVNKKDILEGCLSLPHYYGPLSRASKITITYKNEDEKEICEEFKGFTAQIVQHEIDHLDGILFVDRILEQKAPLYKFGKNGDWERVKIT